MKLSPITIFVIGICVAFAAAMVTLSQFLPNMQEARYNNDNANKLIAQAQQQEMANKRVEEAVAYVTKVQQEWQQVVRVKTPPNDVRTGGINLAVNRWQLTNDSVVFRNNIQRAVNNQLRKGGVTVVTGPTVPAPPGNATQIVEYYNYPAIRFPVLVFDLGAVTVRGTKAQIMQNVQAWSAMPNYLAVTDGLQLQGTSPTMTGTYNVTIVAYIRGNVIAPPVPEGGAASGGGGAPTLGGAAGAPKGGTPPKMGSG